MITIAHLAKLVYSAVAPDITTDEVILTDKQRAHIFDRHPEHAEHIIQYAKAAIEDPDYLLQDKAYATAIVLKEIAAERERLKVIVRLATPSDPTEYRNSIISAYVISERTWEKYLRNKKILYKRGGA